MSQFENSEVMLKYAEMMKDNLVKRAWTWRDIATELGIEAGITAAWAALAAAGVVSGPPGWAAIIGGTAITLALWYITRQMDDNLPDLIDRLEDLDPNENYEAKVQGWIAKLNYYRPFLAAAPTTTDEKERARLNSQKTVAVNELVDYLDQMWIEWNQEVKKNLNDMIFDIGQAEAALKGTITAIKKGQQDMKAAANQATQGILSELKQTSGRDYNQIANEIVALYEQLKQLSGGRPPRFTTSDEQGAWTFAKNLTSPRGRSITQQDIQIAGPLMQNLKSQLEYGLKQVKNRHLTRGRTPAVASSKPLLSKRALMVHDGEKEFRVIMPRETGRESIRRPTRQKGGTRAVRNLQRSINKANYKQFGMPIDSIVEDGIYGQITADALSGVLSNWGVANLVGQHVIGVSRNSVLNIDWMRRLSPDAMNRISTIISNPKSFSGGTLPEQGIARKVQPRPTERQISVRDKIDGDTVVYPGAPTGARCNPGKENPISSDILACLKQYFRITDPDTGQELYAYDWLQGIVGAKNRRLFSDSKMVRIINDQFPPSRFTASDWSKDQFVSAVKLTPEYKKRQKIIRRKEQKISRAIRIPEEREKLLHYMKNYFKVFTRADEERFVYNWLDTLGLGEDLMYQYMNSFVRDKLGGSRVWDPRHTPSAFKGFILSERMGGREGELRLI